jgi:hypothetical protein
MLVTEYKQKVIDLLREYKYKEIVNQHDMMIQFTDCNIFYDIVYYFYCKNMTECNRMIHTQHEFLFLLPPYLTNYRKYVEPAKLEYRKYKINKIILNLVK